MSSIKSLFPSLLHILVIIIVEIWYQFEELGWMGFAIPELRKR